MTNKNFQVENKGSKLYAEWIILICMERLWIVYICYTLKCHSFQGKIILQLHRNMQLKMNMNCKGITQHMRECIINGAYDTRKINEKGVDSYTVPLNHSSIELLTGPRRQFRQGY